MKPLQEAGGGGGAEKAPSSPLPPPHDVAAVQPTLIKPTSPSGSPFVSAAVQLPPSARPPVVRQRGCTLLAAAALRAKSLARVQLMLITVLIVGASYMLES
jgi:hypothetical protein